MKYTSKKQVIEGAQAAGSAAKTYHGAARYLIAQAADLTPLYRRGGGISIYDRSARDREIYTQERHGNRHAAHLGYIWTRRDAYDEADRLNAILTDPAREYLESRWPYRRSHSRWAGGDHNVTVSITDEPGISAGATTEWSSNGKWAGSNSYADFWVSRETLYWFPHLMTPDGLALIHAHQIVSREYEITWLEQGRGFELRPVSGYLIRGYHVQAPTVEIARRRAQRARQKSIAALLAKRQIKKTLPTIWVGVQDSLSAGNCRTATENFAQKLSADFGGEIGGIRADILLSLRSDVYAQRAVGAASRRYTHATI